MRKNHENQNDQSPGAEVLEASSNGKSRKMRAGFATLAVLGLGAGLTMAAWTGNVNFLGNAQAGDETSSPTLMGRVVDGGVGMQETWDVSDVGLGTITIPLDTGTQTVVLEVGAFTSQALNDPDIRLAAGDVVVTPSTLENFEWGNPVVTDTDSDGILEVTLDIHRSGNEASGLQGEPVSVNVAWADGSGD